MNVKHNVRQRRNERMKHIQHQLEPGSRHDPPGSPLSRKDREVYFPAAGAPYTADETELRWDAEEGSNRPIASHGFNPSFDPRLEDPEYVWKQSSLSKWKHIQEAPGNRRGPFASLKTSFLRRMLVSAVLFGLVWGGFHMEQPWAQKGREWVAASLTKSADFSKAAAWYEKQFDGTPAFIPSFHFWGAEDSQKTNAEPSLDLPLDKAALKTIRKSGTGLLLYVDEGVSVKAAGKGRVLLAANTTTTGQTVIVQHTSGWLSIYGNLDHLKVKKNDWVESGQELGTAAKPSEELQSAVYFALKDKDGYVNPADVIAFD